MSGERDRVSPERKREEEHLAETLAVVRKNVEAYSSEVSRMQADIDEMLEHFHDNDVEVLTILNNTITLHDHMKRALIRNERALKKPYFRTFTLWNVGFLIVLYLFSCLLRAV